MDIPQELQDFIKQIMCGRCGTPNGRGLVVNPIPEGDGIFLLAARCLRCGQVAHGRFKVASTEPAGTSPDISTDEVLDLHEALKSDDWLAQLTKTKS